MVKHSVKDLDKWYHNLRLKWYFKGTNSHINLVDIIEKIINGENIESEIGFLVLPKMYDNEIDDLIEKAQNDGNLKRKKEILALKTFFEFREKLEQINSNEILIKVEEIEKNCALLNSPNVESFIFGSLGAILNYHGLIKPSLSFTKYAIEAAKRINLRWAEIQWSMNYAIFRMKDAPNEVYKEFNNLLVIAKKEGYEKIAGYILNNLAVLSDRFLSNQNEAIKYQEEAVSIAQSIGDEASELNRIFHLAHMKLNLGQLQSALENFDRGFTLDVVLGFSEKTFHLFRHLSKLMADQFKEETQKILSTHLTFSKSPHTKDDISAMLEKAQLGEIYSYGDPSQGSVFITPDNSFAHSLSIQKQWEALLVYAYQWMEHSFLVGDNRGFYWLAVAFRSLGYNGFADQALYIGMILPKAFEKHSTSNKDK